MRKCVILILYIIRVKGGTAQVMKTIALVSCDIDESYHNPFSQSFVDTCKELDFRVLWFQSLSGKFNDEIRDEGEMNIFNLINFDLIDALVIMTMTFKADDVAYALIKKAKEKNIPVISIDEDIEAAYSISLGYERALEEVIRHIITKHGARNIKFIGGDKGNDASDAREAVFCNVMKEYGLECGEDNIDYGYFWWSSAADAVQRHYDKFGSMPDAFVCANDSMAVGVCSKLNELGYKIPDDVIVTGIDGIPEGNTHIPSITTLMRDVSEAGRTAALRLSQIFSGELSPVGKETVDGTILYRESCGCEPVRLSIDDNKQKHDLYGQVELWNGFSDSIIQMSEAATGNYSFEETLDKITLFLKNVWTKECWLCICNDFISSANTLEDVFKSQNSYRTEGYSDVMGYVLHGIDDKKFDFLPPFKSEKMLPELDMIFKKYNNIMFLPLHFQKRAIGYIGFEFAFSERNYHILRSLVTNVSKVLENARIQSELKAVVGRLEDMYIHDSMTNLYNRRGFYQLAPQIYNKCISDGVGFMIVSIDLDNLKGINDTYGHHEGDNAIITVADALRSASNEYDINARFGGDEYITAGICVSESYAENFVTRVKEYLDNYNKNSGKPYLVEASCGLYSLVPATGKTIDEFIKAADERMYDQKSVHRKHTGYCRRRI